MTGDLFTGELVSLRAIEAESAARAFVRWNRDSEYQRLETTEPVRLWSETKSREWIEKNGANPDEIAFAIHTRAGDRLIGSVGLEISEWSHGNAYVGIGIGERADWGHGYGTDAMRIILRYAFSELNLHRVSLNTFEYNPRAIRSYEKAGFKHEGAVRGWLNRSGRRYDVVYMGILREEWERYHDNART